MEIHYLDLARITALHAEEFAHAASEVIASGHYLNGPRLQTFEKEYSAYVAHLHCIGCGNGLDALTLILRGYRELGLLHDDDEILVPANTFIATILSITENHLRPVLIEPRISDFQLDDALLERAISPRTRAIMLVHLYGYNSLTQKILDLCESHRLLLLQDCAQSHGFHHVYDLPSYSHLRGASAHSFYPGKNLGAMADAGAVTTDDAELSDVVRALINYGSTEKYVFRYKGRNSRMDELTAALLSIKLKYLDRENARRHEIALEYTRKIHNPLVTLPPCHGVHHIFPILSPERDRLRTYLKEKGVDTLIHYPIPPHLQECYSQWRHLSLPITERIHREELSLPLHQALTHEEVEYIVDCVNDFV